MARCVTAQSNSIASIDAVPNWNLLGDVYGKSFRVLEPEVRSFNVPYNDFTTALSTAIVIVCLEEFVGYARIYGTFWLKRQGNILFFTLP